MENVLTSAASSSILLCWWCLETRAQSVRFEPMNKRSVSTMRHGVGWPWSRIWTCSTKSESSGITGDLVWTSMVPLGCRCTNDGEVDGDSSKVISPLLSWSWSEASRWSTNGSVVRWSRFSIMKGFSRCSSGQLSFSSRISMERDLFVPNDGLPWSLTVNKRG